MCLSSSSKLPKNCKSWLTWRVQQGNLFSLQTSIDSNNTISLQAYIDLVPDYTVYNCSWLLNVTFLNSQNQSQYSHPCSLANYLSQFPAQETNCSSSTNLCIAEWSTSINSTDIFYCFPLISNQSVPEIVPQVQFEFYDPASLTDISLEVFNLSILLTGNISNLANNNFTGVILNSVLSTLDATVTDSSFDLDTLVLHSLYPSLYFNLTQASFVSGNFLTLGQTYYFSHTLGVEFQDIGIYLAVESIVINSTQALIFTELYRSQLGTLGAMTIPADPQLAGLTLSLSITSSATTSSRLLASTYPQIYQAEVVLYITQPNPSEYCSLYFWNSPFYNLCELRYNLILYISMLFTEIIFFLLYLHLLTRKFNPSRSSKFCLVIIGFLITPLCITFLSPYISIYLIPMCAMIWLLSSAQVQNRVMVLSRMATTVSEDEEKNNLPKVNCRDE